MKSRERKKLYIVIGLAVIFAVVGYFRFLHGKITFFNQTERGAAIPAAVEVPAVDLKGIQPAGEPLKMVFDGPRTGLRDIFSPVKAPASKIPSMKAATMPVKPLPTLQFAGTIVGGKRPIAIINGQFLRIGEMIADFEVVAITRNQVILSGGGRKILLNILTGAEERSP
jgi:hypothetical protein